jgi:hypothetical protein
MSTHLYNLLEEVMHKRNAHLEMYAAAFVKEVGTHEASQYVLIERIEHNKITWSFEKKHD